MHYIYIYTSYIIVVTHSQLCPYTRFFSLIVSVWSGYCGLNTESISLRSAVGSGDDGAPGRFLGRVHEL